MSQTGFGDSSSQESIDPSMPEPQSQFQSVSSRVDDSTSVINVLPRQVVEQELHFCTERSQQAQVLLRQAQEQLQLSQLVIQRQETLTQTLQSRIDQLERELQDVHVNCDELRDRLKRQQHHTSQLKAALERCLDTSTPATNDMALSALESWSIAKLSDEKIAPIEASVDSPLQNVVKIVPSPQPVAPIESSVTLELDAESTLEPISPEQPDPRSLTIRSQPISPLIVRPHKASQGSPIAPNLPHLQIVTEPKSSPISSWRNQVQTNISPQPTMASQANEDVMPKMDSQNLANTSDASADFSGLSVTNSAMVSTVTAPKFIQSLHGNNHGAVNADEDQIQELASVKAGSKKVVQSLAAVQLPQFPPLTRR